VFLALKNSNSLNLKNNFGIFQFVARTGQVARVGQASSPEIFLIFSDNPDLVKNSILVSLFLDVFFF